MRILLSLTYYHPNVSGLTIYVKRLASGLVERGHDVTVLAAQHAPETLRAESVDGVRIIRVPVNARIGKGPVMAMFAPEAAKLARSHDIVSLHLPQAESPLAALPFKLLRKPVVATYHCDLQLPTSRLNRVVNSAVDQSNRLTGRLADRIVAYTQDYADHSPFLRSFADKVAIILPPITMRRADQHEVDEFRASLSIDSGPVLGFASRLATEKGIEVAIDALPGLIEDFPELVVLFAGPYTDVIGEEEYRHRLTPTIERLGRHWRFLGPLDAAQLPAFYGALDLLLMTSINSTESFGLVQVEAMLNGAPVVTSNLPGVRQPVTMTGMGEIVAIGDTQALESGIRKVLASPEHYGKPVGTIESMFAVDKTLDAYESLFRDLTSTQGRPA